MRKLIFATVVAVGAWNQPLAAQVSAEELAERRAEAAAEARAGVSCPADVEWPELPEEGRRIIHCCAVPAGEPPPSPEQLAEWSEPRTDIEVPQYAYYYHAPPDRTKECLPVIVVQAERHSLGWIGVYDRPPAAGGADEEFFDLLGTEPPPSPPSGDVKPNKG
jgi:hypothetical protein